MKKTLGILILVLCLLLTAGAMADETDRVKEPVSLPDGLILQTNGFVVENSQDFSSGAVPSTGKVNYFTVTLNIDTDKTDWNKLVTNGGLGDDNLYIRWNLEAPGADYQKAIYWDDYTFPYWSNGFNYNADFDYAFARDLYGAQITRRMSFATYLRQNEMITFTLEPAVQYALVRWYKSETDYVTDIIKLVCNPNIGTKPVSPSYVEELQPDTGDQVLSASVAAKNSEIKYRVNEGLSTLTTKVKAPAGAASCKYDRNGAEQTASVDAQGWISLSTPADSTQTCHYVLKWNMQDGSPLTTQALVITVSVKGSKPTVADPDKDPKMNAFEALEDGETMDFRLNPLAASLMTVEKNKDGVTGWMNIKLKNTTGIPSVAWTDLQDAAYEIELPVPDGAKKAVALQLPGNIFEPIDMALFDQFMGRSWDPDNNGSVSVAGQSKYVMKGAILKNMTPGDKRIAVYAPYITADEDRGEPWVIYFYDDQGDRMGEKGSYAIVTVSELGTLTTTDVIPMEGQLPDGTVVNPVLVSSSYTGWQLQTEYNIQSGNQAVQMNLTLLNEDGDEARLEEGSSNVFYLPYPEGMSYESGATWTLRHYLDEEYTRYELLTVTATEHGLRFETDSLSPFVLLWDMPAQETPIPDATEVPSTPSATSAPNVPQTGDNTPLALYAALLALSLAAAVALLRRKAVR